MTKSDIKRIVKDMVIIIDTREKKYKHITLFLDSINVPYIRKKLDVADYSFILPNYPELMLDEKFVVELKGSIDELAGNFTSGRERFAREFERLGDNQKIHLVLEDFTWRKLMNHSYRSRMSPNAYKATLIAWSIKYDFKVWNCVPKDSGHLIYEILKKELENSLEKILENL